MSNSNARGQRVFVTNGAGTATGDITVAIDQATSGANSVKTYPQGGALTDRSGTIAAIDTSQTLMAANTSRKYIFFQNVSATDIWLDPRGGTAVKDKPSIKLPQNSIWEPEYIPVGAITVISAATGNYTAFEA